MRASLPETCRWLITIFTWKPGRQESDGWKCKHRIERKYYDGRGGDNHDTHVSTKPVALV